MSERVVRAVENRLCAILADDPAVDLTSVRAAEWDAMLDVAIEHRVHLLLAEQLEMRAAWAWCPERVCEELHTAQRRQSLIGECQVRELRAVLHHLAGVGVHPVLFKGAALAHSCYRQPWLRPRGDVDLLVRDVDEPLVRSVMEDAGYQRPSDVDGNRITRQFHYRKRCLSSLDYAFDFHRRISEPEVFADLPSFEVLSRSAVELPPLGPHARTPDDVHSLLIACVHRVAHHNDAQDLIWLYDIHLLAQRLTPAMWDVFVALAARTGTRAICAHGLGQAAAAFGTGIPGTVPTALRPPFEEPSAAFIGGRLRQVDIQMSNLRHLTGIRARLELAWQHLFPAPAYMRAKYRLAHQIWLPAVYAHRIARGAVRWFRPLERL
jgi:hypothetical protein